MYSCYAYQPEYKWTYFKVNLLGIFQGLCSIQTVCLRGGPQWLCHRRSHGRWPLQPILCRWHRSAQPTIHRRWVPLYPQKVAVVSPQDRSFLDLKFHELLKTEMFRVTSTTLYLYQTQDALFEFSMFFTRSILWYSCTSARFELDGLMWVIRVCFKGKFFLQVCYIYVYTEIIFLIESMATIITSWSCLARCWCLTSFFL